MGGPVESLTDVNGIFPAAWNGVGTILFQGRLGMSSVAADGGIATPVKIERTASALHPAFLPDGRRFLVPITQGDRRGVYVGTLGSEESLRLLAEISANAAYVAPVSGQRSGTCFCPRGHAHGPTRAPRDAAGGGRDVPDSRANSVSRRNLTVRVLGIRQRHAGVSVGLGGECRTASRLVRSSRQGIGLWGPTGPIYGILRFRPTNSVWWSPARDRRRITGICGLASGSVALRYVLRRTSP